MERIFDRILRLIESGKVNISEHGYDELAADELFVREIIDSASKATVIEEYVDYPKGPCVLVLQQDNSGNPVHVVWGLPKGRMSPAVMITAYRPDTGRWEKDYLRRRK
jgi:hypothetical protein